MESKNNNTIQLLASGDSFIGKNEVVNGYLNIVCNLFTTDDCIITCEQSTNGTDYQFVDTFVHSINVYGNTTRTQFFVKAYWVRIKVENASFNEIPKIVLTTLFTGSNQDSSLEQPDTVQGSVSVINSMLANYNDGTSDFLKPVACDVNGVLKSNLVVEGITLTPATDGVSVYGSTDQTVANAKLLNTDVDGKLNVNITSLTLDAVDDGVGCFGSSDGNNRVIMKTEADGTLNTISTTINSMLANYNDGVSDFLKPVACDVNGVLKSNLVVEGITLTPATDGLSIYGSTDQNVANAKLLNTDVDGKLNVNITSLSLDAVDDGVGCFGSSDGNNRVIMKTETNGTLNTISTTADALITSLNALVTDNKDLLTKLEINANQLPNTLQMINVGTGTPLQFNTGDVIGSVIDMGVGAVRDNDVCFSGHAFISPGYLDPKVVLQFSINQADWFADGTEASFYKATAVDWQFNFQRNNVGLRYVRLICVSPIQLSVLIATKFKN